MAYINRNGETRPNLAGEFCGNHPRDREPICGPHEDREAARQRQRDFLAHMRFGAPSACAAGSSQEMAAKGFVGLYFKESRELIEGETPIETDEFHEEHVSRTHQGDFR
jgi:hypothetical protein